MHHLRRERDLVITPRATALVSIRRNIGGYWQSVGFSGRCDCGKREDHLFAIDGASAYDKARRFTLGHECGRKTPDVAALVGG